MKHTYVFYSKVEQMTCGYFSQRSLYAFFVFPVLSDDTAQKFHTPTFIMTCVFDNVREINQIDQKFNCQVATYLFKYLEDVLGSMA